jgi:Malic enzyme, NAD binding domain
MRFVARKWKFVCALLTLILAGGLSTGVAFANDESKTVPARALQGLGVVASGARRVTEPMKLAAARVGANSPALKDPSASLLPPLGDIRRVAAAIAVAVGVEVQKQGLAPKISEDELRQCVLKAQWAPTYPSFSE